VYYFLIQLFKSMYGIPTTRIKGRVKDYSYTKLKHTLQLLKIEIDQ